MSDHTSAERLRLFDVGSGRGMVMLNFGLRTEIEFGAYAQAYWEGARVLRNNFIAVNHYRDTDALPIVFLYRHSVELYLKSLCLTGRQILLIRGHKLEQPLNPFRQHKLTVWIPELKKVFQMLEWRWDAPSDETFELPDLEKYIQDLEDLDAKSDAFRYPVKANGDLALPRNFLFHLPSVSAHIDEILRVLDACLSGFSATLDNLKDWAAYDMEQEQEWTRELGDEVEW
ncbi:MAG TPA: hypothetical protein VHR15_02935 [Ktedonobacterales bacterium]|nr:hypothetical protein [Ktedonobacterales bacterium]